MAEVSINRDRLDMLISSFKDAIEENKRLNREATERTRADAAMQEQRQRQTSMSIAEQLEDRRKGLALQEEWDALYRPFGTQAPPKKEDETAAHYEKRLASGIQFVSPDWRGTDWEHETQPALTRLVINQIKADAVKEDAIQHALADDEIREIVKTDETGRRRHEFVSKGVTFIHRMGNANPRRVIANMFGVQHVGAPELIQRPEPAGRQSRYAGRPY